MNRQQQQQEQEQWCDFHGEGWGETTTIEHQGRTYHVCSKCANMLRDGDGMFVRVRPITIASLDDEVRWSGWDNISHFLRETGESMSDIMGNGAYVPAEKDELLPGIPYAVERIGSVTLMTYIGDRVDFVTAPVLVTHSGATYVHFEAFC